MQLIRKLQFFSILVFNPGLPGEGRGRHQKHKKLEVVTVTEDPNPKDIFSLK